ncbi:MAG: class I SAM-dependent methyltransferase [Anaerolineales bacterium]|nr:class I SAM-dependent methyltransferase [Anaerolineales bacterium]
MTTHAHHQSNRAAWNEAARQYERDIDADVAFLRAGGKNLMAPELRLLHDLPTWCRRAIHLQCAGGTDTLSLWNQGAAEVIGIDISDVMIDVARRKSAALNAPATWIRCDLLDTPHELDGTADLVYTGRGALNWLMDIDAWAQVVQRLLKPGGRLFVFEGHPVSTIWDPEADELRFDPNPLYGDYFAVTPVRDQGWPDQYIPADVVPQKDEQAFKYERHWTLADILNALVGVGLHLVRFEEYPDLFWDTFPNMPREIYARLPNTYALLMRKP